MAQGENYEEFVDKFKPKLTTDDCYTPPAVYEVVKQWAIRTRGWEGRKVVRPFYPGGDYQTFNYPDGCVVIDNPPFSILSQICKWYNTHKIPYFLFAPMLTFLSTDCPCHIGANCTIEYENGAKVNTAFVSSVGCLLESAPDLYRLVNEVQEKERAVKVRHLPKYNYPANVMTANLLGQLSRYGISYKNNNGVPVRALDSQKEKGKNIYGKGYFVADNKLAEKLKAEKLKAENTWILSPREQAIVNMLNKKEREASQCG